MFIIIDFLRLTISKIKQRYCIIVIGLLPIHKCISRWDKLIRSNIKSYLEGSFRILKSATSYCPGLVFISYSYGW